MLVGLVSSIPLWSPGRLVRSTSTAWIRMTRRVFRRHTAPITTGSALSKPPTIQAISFAGTRTFSRWANLPFGEATRTRPKGRLNCRPPLDGPGSQAARGIFHSRAQSIATPLIPSPSPKSPTPLPTSPRYPGHSLYGRAPLNHRNRISRPFPSKMGSFRTLANRLRAPTQPNKTKDPHRSNRRSFQVKLGLFRTFAMPGAGSFTYCLRASHVNEPRQV
jgi:hypothetical protein